MRKLAAAILAVPVIAVLYLPVLLRRSIAARVGLALGVGGLIGVAALGALLPGGTVATPPSPIEPLATARFLTDLRVDHLAADGVTIDFSAPMDAASVADALRVEPAAATTLSWDERATRLTIRPIGTWRAGTYYTITIGADALDREGRALGAPARAAFLVRPATTGRLGATTVAGGDRVRLDTSFSLDFDRPVQIASAIAAFRIEPPVAGTFDVSDRPGAADRLVFTPAEPLAPDAAYTVSLGPNAVDVDGGPVEAIAPLTVRAVPAPNVVRFRPGAGSDGVERGATLSVRFTQPMDRATTAAATSVTAGRTPVKGSLRWAEDDTVLVFDPSSAFPYDAEVAMTVSTGARSRDGAPLVTTRVGAFTVEKEPPPPAPKATPAPRATSAPATGSSGGASAGSASWSAVEAYYLRLMNCTRTGGWVDSGGNCDSPGGRSVAPLVLDAGISSRVARPYAKLLATRGVCSHFADGDPGDRLREAGYRNYTWAENIGCRSAANAYDSVLGTHLFYQSEKSYSGGHYVNLMNPAYDRVGIGVWVASGRIRLVVDFYHP